MNKKKSSKKAPAASSKAAAKAPAKSVKKTVKAAAKAPVKSSKPAAKAKPEAKAPLKSKSAAKPKPATKAKVVAKKTTAVKPAAKTASRTVRPKVFGQSPVVREFGFPENVPEIPKSYGRDRLVLMTQDPDYLFSYWEITSRQLAVKESEKRDDQEYQDALRLNWAARSLFEENYVLLPVELGARRWYLRVPFPGLSYHVQIGWLGDKGHFISILESNESESPESWDATRTRLKAAGEVLAYSSRVSKPSGSSRSGAIDETLLTLKDWNPKSLSSSPGAKNKKPKPSGR